MVGRGWGAGQPPGSLLGAKPLGDGKMRWMCERAWPEQTGDLLRLWGQGDIWRTPGLRAAEPGVGRQGRRKETLGFQSLQTLGTWTCETWQHVCPNSWPSQSRDSGRKLTPCGTAAQCHQ